MKRVSILNHVIGPIMRGPSSSHTAGPHRIGRIARGLLGEKPLKAEFLIDPSSSLAVCYHDQGSDLAFVTGLLERELTDPAFHAMFDEARKEGLGLRFALEPFDEADHPNSVLIRLEGVEGATVRLHARSVGGGSIEIASVDGFPVHLVGDSHELLVEAEPAAASALLERLLAWDPQATRIEGATTVLLHGFSPRAPEEGFLASLRKLPGLRRLRHARPVMHPLGGEILFKDTAGLIEMASTKGWSLAEAALAYEERLLELPRETLMAEMDARLAVMIESIRQGLEDNPPMQLLEPTASRLLASERSGELFLGGPHTRAAARALAAMHTNGGSGVVCAAPTGGSAGVLPAVTATLMEDLNISREATVKAMWAAGAIGLALDRRSTFSAEVCGCQVEIGAAGAMAAAAVVEAAGGTALQACDAAATVFQNMMGSVCDLVQGIVEVPCHSRNAALASQAFLCADMILGGYTNPVPLDETIDAVDSVGRMLPEELRCTSRGGLALCPTALAMKRRRGGDETDRR